MKKIVCMTLGVVLFGIAACDNKSNFSQHYVSPQNNNEQANESDSWINVVGVKVAEELAAGTIEAFFKELEKQLDSKRERQLVQSHSANIKCAAQIFHVDDYLKFREEHLAQKYQSIILLDKPEENVIAAYAALHTDGHIATAFISRAPDNRGYFWFERNLSDKNCSLWQ